MNKCSLKDSFTNITTHPKNEIMLVYKAKTRKKIMLAKKIQIGNHQPWYAYTKKKHFCLEWYIEDNSVYRQWLSYLSTNYRPQAIAFIIQALEISCFLFKIFCTILKASHMSQKIGIFSSIHLRWTIQSITRKPQHMQLFRKPIVCRGVYSISYSLSYPELLSHT